MTSRPHIPLLLRTDSYKSSHFTAYPQDTTRMFAYLEARVGARYPETVFFGLQSALIDLLSEPFTLEDIKEAEAFWKAHGEPFDRDGWLHILYTHGGRMPVRIRAVPEGTVVPVDNVLMTVESTDERVPWVVTFLETALMRGVWYPSTVATKSRECKKVILKHLRLTADKPDAEIGFKLHDFGGRGVSSGESAEIGAMAHLVNFLGTDTIEGIVRGQQHYYSQEEMLGFSIPAMEHSTVMAWGPGREAEAFKNFISKNKALGYKMVACVSDTYNIFNAVENLWCGELLDFVRNSGVTVVIRPDSGDPVEVNREILKRMAAKLGGECQPNTKGKLVLPGYYRIIQGDGNNDETDIDDILTAISKDGFSASNIAFGMGGGLLQQVNRDTQRFAYKISELDVAGETLAVAKNPASDPTKRSKAGRVGLYKQYDTGKFVTLPEDCYTDAHQALNLVWDRTLVSKTLFSEVRALAKVGL